MLAAVFSIREASQEASLRLSSRLGPMDHVGAFFHNVLAVDELTCRVRDEGGVVSLSTERTTVGSLRMRAWARHLRIPDSIMSEQRHQRAAIPLGSLDVHLISKALRPDWPVLVPGTVV